eukprot:UN03193
MEIEDVRSLPIREGKPHDAQCPIDIDDALDILNDAKNELFDDSEDEIATRKPEMEKISSPSKKNKINHLRQREAILGSAANLLTPTIDKEFGQVSDDSSHEIPQDEKLKIDMDKEIDDEIEALVARKHHKKDCESDFGSEPKCAMSVDNKHVKRVIEEADMNASFGKLPSMKSLEHFDSVGQKLDEEEEKANEENQNKKLRKKHKRATSKYAQNWMNSARPKPVIKKQVSIDLDGNLEDAVKNFKKSAQDVEIKHVHTKAARTPMDACTPMDQRFERLGYSTNVAVQETVDEEMTRLGFDPNSPGDVQFKSAGLIPVILDVHNL